MSTNKSLTCRHDFDDVGLSLVAEHGPVRLILLTDLRNHHHHHHHYHYHYHYHYHHYHHYHFPYMQAARRSIALWHALTRARVALTIITSQDLELGQELDKFRAELSSLGASVALLRVREPGCVLASQASRYIKERAKQIYQLFCNATEHPLFSDWFMHQLIFVHIGWRQL